MLTYSPVQTARDLHSPGVNSRFYTNKIKNIHRCVDELMQTIKHKLNQFNEKKTYKH